MSVRIDGLVVAITGGAQGLGRATTEALVARGARVAIGDIDVELARSTAEEIGEGAHAFEVDVTSASSMHAFVQQVEERIGPIDVFVNNAGVMIVGDFLKEDDRATDVQVDVNVRGVLNGCRAAARVMVDRGHGHIVNVSSAAGKVGGAHLVTYTATKHAVVGISDSLRAELRDRGVQVSTVMPNVANTRLGQGTAKGLVPMVEPHQVADTVVWIIEKRANEAFVPRWAEVGRAATSWLPSPARDWLFRVAGGHSVTLGSDGAARAAYEAEAIERQSADG